MIRVGYHNVSHRANAAANFHSILSDCATQANPNGSFGSAAAQHCSTCTCIKYRKHCHSSSGKDHSGGSFHFLEFSPSPSPKTTCILTDLKK